MSNQNEPTEEEIANARRENRFMYISVGIVVVLLLGGMGINMLIHKDTNASPTQMTRE